VVEPLWAFLLFLDFFEDDFEDDFAGAFSIEPPAAGMAEVAGIAGVAGVAGVADWALAPKATAEAITAAIRFFNMGGFLPAGKRG